MKHNVNKISLISATMITIMFSVGNLLGKYLLSRELFIPYKPSKTVIPRFYPFGISIFGLIIIFVVAFLATWCIAKLYHRLSKKH